MVSVADTRFLSNRTQPVKIGMHIISNVSHIELSQGYCRPPTKCKWGLRCVLKFQLDRIYFFFGDIANIFVL